MKIMIDTNQVHIDQLDLDFEVFQKLQKKKILYLEDILQTPKSSFKKIGIGKNKYNEMINSIATYVFKNSPALRDDF
jgi:DNA-directed RNA polymerase alpha subunit